MASTNHTTYFDLSQYTANDKPTYLVDYNGDMSKIDAGLHEADSDAKTAISEIGDLSNLTTTAKSTVVASINEVDAEADQNTTNIGNLSNLTTTANSDLVSAINEVDAEADTNTANIGTMANLETTVKTNLVGAVNEVNSEIKKFNFVNFTALSNPVLNGATSDGGMGYTLASNSDYSVVKIYGETRIVINSFNPEIKYEAVIPSSYRPSSDITINPIGVVQYLSDHTTHTSSARVYVTFKSNGDIIIGCNPGCTSLNSQKLELTLIPCILILKNFGDTPTP